MSGLFGKVQAPVRCTFEPLLKRAEGRCWLDYSHRKHLNELMPLSRSGSKAGQPLYCVNRASHNELCCCNQREQDVLFWCCRTIGTHEYGAACLMPGSSRWTLKQVIEGELQVCMRLSEPGSLDWGDLFCYATVVRSKSFLVCHTLCRERIQW